MTKERTTHWVWEPYSTGEGVAFVTEVRGLDDAAQEKVLRGERLQPEPSVIIAGTEPGRFADVLGAFTGILFVSPAVRTVLEGATGARLQFIGAVVRGRKGLSYSIVNVLETLPAIDLERSRYETFEGTTAIRRIHELRLRALPAQAPQLFHAAEDRSMVLVSDELRRRLLETTDRPGRLVPAEKYRNEY